jgi:signal transduction histidine kinase
MRRHWSGYALLLVLPLVGTAAVAVAYLRSALAHRRVVEEAAVSAAQRVLRQAHDEMERRVSRELGALARRARAREVERDLARALWQAHDSIGAPLRSISVWDRAAGRLETYPAERGAVVRALLPPLGATSRLDQGLSIVRNGGGARAPVTVAIAGLRRDGKPALALAYELDPGSVARLLGRELERIVAAPGVVILHPSGDTLLRLRVEQPAAVSAELRFAMDSAGGNSQIATLMIPPGAIASLVPGGLPASPWPLLLGSALLSLCLTLLALAGLTRLRRLVEAREQFVSGVTHEVRTPITQILLYAETLQLERPTPEARRRAAGVIVREARRLSQLADNALAFARGRRADVSLRPEILDLGEVVRDAVRAVEPLAAERGSRLVLALRPRTRVIADAGSVEQILRNLVENAIRHGTPGQRVRVEVAQVGGWGTVQVTDEGAGVPVGERERVWEPFVRGTNTTAPGTGLGLSVVKQLVELQDGRVRVGDAPERGALFEVCLPAATRLPPALPEG